MSSARSRVSQPSRDSRQGSSRLTYQPSAKCQSEWCSPKRCTLRTPLPSQILSPSDQSASSRLSSSCSGRPAKIFPRAPGGSQRKTCSAVTSTTTCGIAKRTWPNARLRQTATSPSDHIPAVRKVGEGPGRIGAPVFPARRPRPLSEDALALRANLARLRFGEPAEADRLLEHVLVLPLPGAVRLDPDVEDQVIRVESEPRAPDRLLDVHVPAG